MRLRWRVRARGRLLRNFPAVLKAEATGFASVNGIIGNPCAAVNNEEGAIGEKK